MVIGESNGKKTLIGIRNKRLTEYTVPEGIEIIWRSVFSGCKKLQKVNLPSTLIAIKNCAFESCSNLNEIKLPDSLEEIQECAFYNCTSLKEVILPPNLKSIGYAAFMGCKSLEQIIIPDSVTEIGESVCKDCENIERVVFPVFMKVIPKDAFSNCSNLKEIKLGDNCEIVCDRAFWKTALTSLVLPATLRNIGVSAFSNTQIEFVEFKGESLIIEKYAFYNCCSLRSFTVGIEEPSNLKIENHAFLDTNHCTLYVPHSSVSKFRYARYKAFLAHKSIGD